MDKELAKLLLKKALEFYIKNNPENKTELELNKLYLDVKAKYNLN